MDLKNANIVLGVSGGIAAYKSADLASKLIAAGAQVKVIMTDCARNLIAPATFQALTRQPVYTTMWQQPQDFDIGHIELADWASALVVAPATANLIGKLAAGICDDLLTTTLCVCWQKPILLAPAMNSRMWANPIVQDNLARVCRMLNIKTVGPETGRLACGDQGVGRMAEPAAILEAIKHLI